MIDFPKYLEGMIDAKKIDFYSYGTKGRITRNGLMFISNKQSEEEQVLSVLHEVLHFHPHFMSYTGGIFEGTLNRDESVEREIDAMAYKLYDARPDLVEKVEEAIAESIRLEEERKFRYKLINMKALNEARRLRQRFNGLC